MTDLEYLLVHRGGRGQNLVYELLFDDDGNDQPQVMGLIDIRKLGYDAERQGQVRPKLTPSQER